MTKNDYNSIQIVKERTPKGERCKIMTLNNIISILDKNNLCALYVDNSHHAIEKNIKICDIDLDTYGNYIVDNIATWCNWVDEDKDGYPINDSYIAIDLITP